MNSESLIREIYRSTIHNKSIQSIGACCSKYLQNPIIIRDTIGSVLAYTSNGYQGNWWDILTTEGKESLLKYESLKSHPDMDNAQRPYILTLPDESIRAMNGNIAHDKFKLGSIIVLEVNHHFNDSDFDKLQEICEIIAHHIIYNSDSRFIENPNQEYFLSKLLCGEYVDQEDLKKHLFKQQNNHRFLLVICRGKNKIKSLFILPEFYNKFSLYYPDAKVMIYDDDIVLLFYRKSKGIKIDLDLDIILNMAQKYQLTFGFSDTFEDLNQIKSYYDQAITALYYGNRYGINNPILYSRHFYIFKILQLLDDDVLDNLIDESIKYLYQYDIKYDTDNLKTFCEMIITNMDVTLCAQRLGIHRTTMHYRINKIEEIINMTISSINNGYNLTLSFYVLIYKYYNDKLNLDCSYLHDIFQSMVSENRILSAD